MRCIVHFLDFHMVHASQGKARRGKDMGSGDLATAAYSMTLENVRVSADHWLRGCLN